MGPPYLSTAMVAALGIGYLGHSGYALLKRSKGALAFLLIWSLLGVLIDILTKTFITDLTNLVVWAYPILPAATLLLIQLPERSERAA
jgi:hypothetical protein